MEEIETYDAEAYQEGFTVQNDEQASWATRKLRAIVERQMSNQAVADKELQRVEAWLKEENGRLDRQANYFRELLIDYMRRERENGRKSISLPYGTIKSRVNPDKVEIDDEFTQWAIKERPELLTVPPTPAPKPIVAEVKKLLQAGETLPHVQLIEGGVSFSIEVK